MDGRGYDRSPPYRTCGYGGNGIIPTLTHFLFQMSMIVMQLTQIISSPKAARS